MNHAIPFIKKNVVELFLLIISLMAGIGSSFNYYALVLAGLLIILIYSQQKSLGLAFGILIGLLGAYLCLALLSDIHKITAFTTWRSVQFIGVGSIFCLSILASSFLLIKKYFQF